MKAHGFGITGLAEDVPGDMTRLRRDSAPCFGIAAHLVGEALALAVDQNATLGNDGPGQGKRMRVRHRAVALIGAHVGDACPKFETPFDRIAGV